MAGPARTFYTDVTGGVGDAATSLASRLLLGLLQPSSWAPGLSHQWQVPIIGTVGMLCVVLFMLAPRVQAKLNDAG